MKGNDVYERVFEVAKVGNLTPDEMNEYQQSLKIQRDNNSVISCAKKEGLAVGIELGKAEGLELGGHKKAIEMALKLKTKNTSIEEISELTGLSCQEIELL